jgi:hypothetical protein
MLVKVDHDYLTLQRRLSHLNGRKLDHRQVQASYISQRLAASCPILRICSLSWYCMASVSCRHDFAIYIQVRLNVVCKSRTGVNFGKFPVAWIASFCRCCNFKSYVSAGNYYAGEAYVINELISALWRVSLTLALKRSLLSRE